MDATHYVLILFGAALLIYMTWKDWIYNRELEAFRKWHIDRTLEWEAERQRILDKAFALSEKEKLAVIHLEERQLDLREQSIRYRADGLRALDKSNGIDYDLSEEVLRAKNEAIKKLNKQKENDAKIKEIL